MEMRAKRIEAGYTQAALAKLMGVKPNTVARWERGEIKLHQGLVALAFRVIELERGKE